MRQEFLKPYERIYPLCEYDFDRTLDLCARLAQSHRSAESASIAGLVDDRSQTAIEIISDVQFYALQDSLYVWHYGLLRCHAIFETLIGEVFLAPGGGVPRGLTARLQEMDRRGFPMSADEKAGLDQWYRLRNELAHDVPDHYHGSRLEQSDVQEFVDLLKRIIARWATWQEEGGPMSPNER
jgi:hypothetical protein